jgi:hypothetical protein
MRREALSDGAKLAAQAFDTYYAYFGTCEFDAAKSVITHHLKASLSPYETGVHLKLIVRSQQNAESRVRTLAW